MKTYSEDDITKLSDKLIELLTFNRFDSGMLNIIGHILELAIQHINNSE